MAFLKRLPGWWIATILAVATIAGLAPHQLGVLVFKLAQVTFAVSLSYLADRSLFRDAPELTDESTTHSTTYAARLIARALVSVAVILGLAIGL